MYYTDIQQAATHNTNFRQVLATTTLSQIVVMSLQPGEDIGREAHHGHDQIFIFFDGVGRAQIANRQLDVAQGCLLVVPQDTEHNIVNTGPTPMQFCTIYTPPTHRDGTVHATKQNATRDRQDHWEA